jgi:hypothetical protein
MSETTPNPGSPEAEAIGCRCPILDNAHGKGCGWGPGKFWINGDCPVHVLFPQAETGAEK